MAEAALVAGFADPVREAQAVFRAVMMALARPGTLRAIMPPPPPPAPLDAGLAAIAMALCDFETRVWLDAPLAASDAVTGYLRFQTGAPLTEDPAAAAFALVSDPSTLTGLAGFAQGTPDYPDRSTTLVMAVPSLAEGAGWTLRGPGIDGKARLAVGGLPAEFSDWLADNRSQFPLGVDLVFVAGDRVAALPRSTAVTA